VGIGVGAAVAVILIVAAILWFWRARRRKSMMDRPTELETTPSRLPASYDEGAGVDVYKREAGPPGELPVPPPKPSELESRQLAELEGNSKGMR
jgi:FtsZ-interacting cell division protein ZipA